ncbi:copper resistance protein NlpE [Shewanella waksmanii]|uniref:copper resistance protein NlpE n=1 Tax=Shewanella waksmanii TaxID=213783 RepID=UPI0004921CAC|nr:copper resistance protein NlpE [Shewanella waksmanii]
MKRISLISIVLLIAGCTSAQPNNNLAANDNVNSNTRLQPAELTPVGDTSQNALDWNGTYQGTLPCASCEGIATTVQLNRDNSFTMSSQYLGEGDKVFSSEGKLFWLGRGNIIRLGEGESQPLFLVGENQLFMLDRQGNRITGALAEHYRLEKVQP